MENIIKEFLVWCEYNLTDIFELIDEPDKVIQRYMDSMK